MARAIAICKCSKCGKEFEKINYNCRNRADANNWETWAAETFDTCSECWKKEQEEARAERAKELPQLVGSPKQIAWALKLRDEWMQNNAKLIESFTDEGKQFIKFIVDHTESKFWIENCGVADKLNLLSTSDFMRNLLAEFRKG